MKCRYVYLKLYGSIAMLGKGIGLAPSANMSAEAGIDCDLVNADH